MKRPEKGAVSGPSPVRHEGWPKKDFPELWEHLTARVYDDGEPRQTATVTLFLNDDGSWGASLKDRQNNRALFGKGMTVEAAMASLEDQLCSDTPGWRADREQTGSSRRLPKSS